MPQVQGRHTALRLPPLIPNAAPPADIHAVKPGTRWITVTPELAMKWLDEANINNRKVREEHVKKLADDMAAGRWRGKNGEPIKFDRNGRLIEGQHRLWACVQSDTPFETLMITDVDPEDYKTSGIGRPKNLADFLGPVYGEKNVMLLASTLRLVHLWRTDRLKRPGWKSLSTSIAELEIVYHDHSKLPASVVWVSSHKACRDLLNPSYATLIHYAGTLEGKAAMVESFLERVGSGLGLLDDDPVWHLRKFLLSQRGLKPGHKRPGREYMLALAIKAWTASKEGRKVRALQFRVDETFPKL